MCTDLEQLCRLLVRIWFGDFDQSLEEIQTRAHKLFADISTPLFQVLIAIALVRNHVPTLRSLLSTTPPRETIFDVMDFSKVSQNPSQQDLDAWTTVISSPWIHRPSGPWHRAGWMDFLLYNINATAEADQGKLEAFMKALKAHKIIPYLSALEPLVTSNTPAGIANLSVVFSVFPVRLLGPSVNSLLRVAALGNYHSKVETIQALLQAGLNPNWIPPKLKYDVEDDQRDGRGETHPEYWGSTDRDTALHVAAQYGYVDLAKVLLKHGARRGVKDGLGKTAEQRARKYNHPEMVDLLGGGWFFGWF
jgi:hypothetical protein